MKKIVLAMLTGIVLATSALSQPVAAVNLFGGCTQADCSAVKQDKLNYTGDHSLIWNIISAAIAILAGVAVIMIVIGGIRYTISQGDQGAVTSAKNTILYAVIGLVVAIFSGAIVALITRFFNFQ